MMSYLCGRSKTVWTSLYDFGWENSDGKTDNDYFGPSELNICLFEKSNDV